MMQARRQLREVLRSSRALSLGFTPVVAALAGYVPPTHAQAQLPVGLSESVSTSSTADDTAVAESAPPPASEREWFAVTFNPLNLIINRYGVDLQLQLTRHHSIIIAPHYDYLSGQYDTDPREYPCRNDNIRRRNHECA